MWTFMKELCNWWRHNRSNSINIVQKSVLYSSYTSWVGVNDRKQADNRLFYIYCWRRNFLYAFENALLVNIGSFNWGSSDSHSLGPAYLNDRSPNLVLTRGTRNCCCLGYLGRMKRSLSDDGSEFDDALCINFPSSNL